MPTPEENVIATIDRWTEFLRSEMAQAALHRELLEQENPATLPQIGHYSSFEQVSAAKNQADHQEEIFAQAAILVPAGDEPDHKADQHHR